MATVDYFISLLLYFACLLLAFAIPILALAFGTYGFVALVGKVGARRIITGVEEPSPVPMTKEEAQEWLDEEIYANTPLRILLRPTTFYLQPVINVW